MSRRKSLGITALVALEGFAATPSTCAICLKPITSQQPSDGPVPHGDGVAHESCQQVFTDELLTSHPPRGHRPKPRGQR